MHWSDRRASVAVPDSLSYARMARIGASRPLPRVAATVCFLITERALSLGGRDWSSCPNPGIARRRRRQGVATWLLNHRGSLGKADGGIVKWRLLALFMLIT